MGCGGSFPEPVRARTRGNLGGPVERWGGLRPGGLPISWIRMRVTWPVSPPAEGAFVPRRRADPSDYFAKRGPILYWKAEHQSALHL
jgi:hypothetical protein